MKHGMKMTPYDHRVVGQTSSILGQIRYIRRTSCVLKISRQLKMPRSRLEFRCPGKIKLEKASHTGIHSLAVVFIHIGSSQLQRSCAQMRNFPQGRRLQWYSCLGEETGCAYGIILMRGWCSYNQPTNRR